LYPQIFSIFKTYTANHDLLEIGSEGMENRIAHPTITIRTKILSFLGDKLSFSKLNLTILKNQYRICSECVRVLMKFSDESGAIAASGNVLSSAKIVALQSLPIGVFDSGVGGLTVLRALQKQLPQESFLYFGDTAHVPYGTRSADEIQTLVRQILSWMMQQPIKMAVMACNTSSALALDAVRQEFPIPVLGIILPGAKAAVRQGQRIGVIATPATVKSDCYRQAIQEINPDIDVFQEACPEFVTLIEHRQLHLPETRRIVEQRVQPLMDAGIDTLVYGCTHYPHLDALLSQILPKDLRRVDPALQMATAVHQELDILQLRSRYKQGITRFAVSGSPRQFAQSCYQWLGYQPLVEFIELPGIRTSVSASVQEVAL
jgi:glutamate racemase